MVLQPRGSGSLQMLFIAGGCLLLAACALRAGQVGSFAGTGDDVFAFETDERSITVMAQVQVSAGTAQLLIRDPSGEVQLSAMTSTTTAPILVSRQLRATPGTWTATVTFHDADGVSEIEFRAGTEAP